MMKNVNYIRKTTNKSLEETKQKAKKKNQLPKKKTGKRIDQGKWKQKDGQ